MTPCIDKIRSSKGCRRFLFLCRSFSIGMSKSDDLIICHSLFLNERIQISNGHINRFTNQSQTKEKKEAATGKKRLEAEGLIIQVWTPNIKWYFLLSAMIFGVILMALFFLIKPASKPLQDWTWIDLPSQGIYGFLKQDLSHPEGVRFRFTLPWPGQSNLIFTPGSESGDGSVSVSVDGHDINSDIALPQGWGNEVNLTIPASLSQRNTHILEIRPNLPEGTFFSWGIRDVRIVPFHAGKKAGHNFPDDLVRVRATLEDPMAQGADFSQCYIILAGYIQKGGSDEKEELDSLRQRVESRMLDLTRGTIVQIRSFIFSGQMLEAKRRMMDLREWIPETWPDGMRMLRDLERILQ